MFKSKKLAVLAALLSLLMLVSMLAVPAFAEEAGTTAEIETTGVAETETAAEPETEAGTGSETEAGTGNETGASTDATTGASTEASTKEETTTSNKTEAEAKKKQRTRGFINLGVGAVILIALGILAFKFRAKIPGWWKGLKSECGKITWCPKDKLKKNTLVVVVIIVAIAIAIGVLDFAFSRGMILLGELFH